MGNNENDKNDRNKYQGLDAFLAPEDRLPPKEKPVEKYNKPLLPRKVVKRLCDDDLLDILSTLWGLDRNKIEVSSLKQTYYENHKLVAISFNSYQCSTGDVQYIPYVIFSVEYYGKLTSEQLSNLPNLSRDYTGCYTLKGNVYISGCCIKDSRFPKDRELRVKKDFTKDLQQMILDRHDAMDDKCSNQANHINK